MFTVGDKVQKRSASLVPLNQNTAGHQFGFWVMFLYLSELGKLLLEERGKRKIFTGRGMEKKTSYTYYREALENNSWPKMKTKCWGMRKLETQKSWS